MKTLCIIQARMSSTRLPGKVLLPLAGRPMLEYQLLRVKQVRNVDKIIVATSTKPIDDQVAEVALNVGVGCFRGDEDDVLGRYYHAASEHPEHSIIVRLTGDCPLADPAIIDDTISYFKDGGFDFAGNVDPPTFPDGLDVEVFSFEALARAFHEAAKTSDREHVTQFLRRNPEIFKMGNFRSPTDYSTIRLTVDELADYEVVKFVAENSALEDGHLKHINLLEKNPNIKMKNTTIIRNEGLIKSLAKDEEDQLK